MNAVGIEQVRVALCVGAPVSEVDVVVLFRSVDDVALGLCHPSAVAVRNGHHDGVVWADEVNDFLNLVRECRAIGTEAKEDRGAQLTRILELLNDRDSCRVVAGNGGVDVDAWVALLQCLGGSQHHRVTDGGNLIAGWYRTAGIFYWVRWSCRIARVALVALGVLLLQHLELLLQLRLIAGGRQRVAHAH